MRAIAQDDMKESPIRKRDGVYEYRCPTCRTWWPIDDDHWRPGNGFRRCKACWNGYHKLWERERAKDPEIREVINFKGRIRHALNREKRNAANREWKARNPEYIAAYNAAYKARKKAEAMSAVSADGVASVCQSEQNVGSIGAVGVGCSPPPRSDAPSRRCTMTTRP